jgi:hypothetical protein
VVRSWFGKSDGAAGAAGELLNSGASELNFLSTLSRSFLGLPVGEPQNVANAPNAPEGTPAELRKQDKN